MEIKETDEFIESLLEKDNVQPHPMFCYMKQTQENKEYLATLIAFMQTRCILYTSTGSNSYGDTLVFSKPGRKIMESKISRHAFIEEFNKFYSYN